MLRASLDASCIEGVGAEVVTACAGGAIWTAWALQLGMSPVVTGVLGALPYLAQFVQFPAAWMTSRLGHRRAALWAVTLSRQVLWPLVALPFLPLGPGAQRAVLLSVAALAAVLGVLGNNAWVAWMGELVPSRLRGRFFGRRTALYTASTSLGALGAGLVLDRARAHGHGAVALGGLALLACLAGLFCRSMMQRQGDPSPHGSAVHVDLEAALRPVKDPSARRVLAFQTTWNAAIGVSATFFTLYMLQTLKMGFATIALYNAGLAVVRILALPLWGRALDRLGVRPVLVACSFGIGIIPIIWLFTRPDFFWPILFLDMVLSGVFWGGHGLGSFALPLAVAPKKGRPFYLAAFATAGGAAYALASVSGGFLVEHLPVWTGRSTLFGFQGLFVISALLRFSAGFLALRLREDRARPLSELIHLVRYGAAARLRTGLPSLGARQPRVARRVDARRASR